MALINVNLRDLKVLVVDDSRTARHALRQFLREISVETVELAEDGADAIKKLRDFPADLALCDLHMAPLDGIEFTRLLRSAEDSPNPYLPVLILTADTTAAQLRNALGAGANDFMSKPIKLDSLRRKIQGLFARPMVFVRDGRYLKPLRPSGRPEGAPDSRYGPRPEAKSGADMTTLADGALLTRADLGIQ
ncbi:MAG: response regulator [Proteobacteria bacterium]|nr:response regulator [Pseudomonadota bacterium]